MILNSPVSCARYQSDWQSNRFRRGTAAHGSFDALCVSTQDHSCSPRTLSYHPNPMESLLFVLPVAVCTDSTYYLAPAALASCSYYYSCCSCSCYSCYSCYSYFLLGQAVDNCYDIDRAYLLLHSFGLNLWNWAGVDFGTGCTESVGTALTSNYY